MLEQVFKKKIFWELEKIVLKAIQKKSQMTDYKVALWLFYLFTHGPRWDNRM